MNSYARSQNFPEILQIPIECGCFRMPLESRHRELYHLMSKFEKLITKIMNGSAISYKEAERVLLRLGYGMRINSSHHTFTKADCDKITLVRKNRLLPYQTNKLRRALHDHNLTKK